MSPLNRWAEDSLEWKPDFHLINEPYPNETLKIRLVDEPAGIDKSADLMIIADNTHPGMPVQVLVERWKVPVPDFIVSVIGTTHESPVTPEQFQYFKPDFNRAVSSSNVWVIGGGSLHGVDKLVSECLKGIKLTHLFSNKLSLTCFFCSQSFGNPVHTLYHFNVFKRQKRWNLKNNIYFGILEPDLNYIL